MVKNLRKSIIFYTFVSMNQQVTDISESLLKMAGEMQSMRKTIDSQYVQICQLNRNIEKLNKKLRLKDKKIEELTERLFDDENPDKTPRTSAVQAHQKQGIPLAPGMEIAYVVKDAKKWEVDPARTASEFDARYYKGLLDKAWVEAAFVFT